MLNVMRGKKMIDIELTDGTVEKVAIEVAWTIPDIYSASGHTLQPYRILKLLAEEKIQFHDRNVILHGIPQCGYASEVFLREEYKLLEPNDELVIDIGGHIGDSPIYFALMGAKKVIAVEPSPYYYELARRNIKENGLENRIELVLAGYGIEEMITPTKSKTVNFRDHPEYSNLLREREFYSLNGLLNHFNINEAILKIDCEGCEYNLLGEENADIRKFKRIIIEYHNHYRSLKDKLEGAGFQVKFLNENTPSILEHPWRFRSRGLLYAYL